VQCAGPQQADRAARAVARCIHRLNPPHRRRLEETLCKFIGICDVQVAHLSGACFEQMARFWVELLYLHRQLGGPAWRRHLEVIEPQAWDELRNCGRRLVLVTPPWGNPAVAAIALNALLGPLTVVGDALTQRLLRSIDPRVGPDGQLRRWPGLRSVSTATAAVALPAALRRGENVLLVVGPQRAGGVPCAFLGQTLHWSAAPARLARREQAALVVTACRREDAALRFTLEKPQIIERTTSGAADTQALVNEMAGNVLRSPEQFLWSRV
jgi:lauroyl/myristoyl acyltransferase